MKLIFLILLVLQSFNTQDSSFDFGKDKSGMDWDVIVDGVMGGLSTGNKVLTDSSLIFSGNISLENNGGFSSIRTPFGDYDLSRYANLEVKYRSSGGVFSLMFEQDKRFYLPYHQSKLPNTNGSWEILKTDLSELIETRLGETTSNTITRVELSQVIRIGLMKLDKRTGPFEIEVDYIHFIRK